MVVWGGEEGVNGVGVEGDVVGVLGGGKREGWGREGGWKVGEKVGGKVWSDEVGKVEVEE